MFDIGVTKLLIVGGIALVVIGPERLPKVARMAGTLLGRAQRYVSDVKAEVNRSIEIEELNKMKAQFDDAARDIDRSVNDSVNEIGSALDGADTSYTSSSDPYASGTGWEPPPPEYRHPGKKWRLKVGATPQWYKQREGVRRHVQSGAARVMRHRPRRLG
ncbi:Sec-independent protein translocase protein TatB [Leptothrix discophora]|uniref:Sec-independent protein translocase protein TatB n=1 Tax=Leptothrix discophora TaxID=89 RepID=A0ABT9G510_LEPDI|nr:Sec-independent protein translocase protein TatB [Leptothrix discophora]MDP4301554.1 Sec-independent protein translocase protein TatB [Leptothrix discophora]